MTSRVAAAASQIKNSKEQEEQFYANQNQERREKAVKWVDKEVRRLISELIKLNRKTTFAQLFGVCGNTFEALSGTLLAAKKKGAVQYEGAMLLMGAHDNVVITLIKDTIGDTPLPTPDKSPVKPLNSRTKGFDSEVVGVNEKCASCSKTVYPAERLGAAGKVFHESCFTCLVCKGKLRPADFCCVNGKIYCKPHYTQLFQSKGGYDAMDDSRKQPEKPSSPLSSNSLPVSSPPTSPFIPSPNPTLSNSPTPATPPPPQHSSSLSLSPSPYTPSQNRPTSSSLSSLKNPISLASAISSSIKTNDSPPLDTKAAATQTVLTWKEKEKEAKIAKEKVEKEKMENEKHEKLEKDKKEKDEKEKKNPK